MLCRVVVTCVAVLRFRRFVFVVVSFRSFWFVAINVMIFAVAVCI